MKNLSDYITQYGLSGWKTGTGANAPLVMMLRDEIAKPGSTQLSALDRAGLQVAFKILNNSSSDERELASANLPFTSLRIDASKVPQVEPTDNDALFQARMDAAFKQYASIVFVHGEKDNPFTQHTDLISNSGVVKKDAVVETDLVALKNYYQGAVTNANMGWNIFDGDNAVITNKAILQNMLELVLQNGIDTPAHVKEVFGNYFYAPGVADAAIQQETKLPLYSQLNDPASDAIIKGYLAYFGRPAEAGGLKFWVDATNRTGGVATDMVDNFGASQEYRDKYGNSSSTEVVNSLYHHLFNRDAEKGGLDFWSHHLDAGNLTLANIAFSVVNAARGSDLVIVEDKVDASRHFTASLDTQRETDLYNTDIALLNARKWLSLISDDQAGNAKLIGVTNDVINKLHDDVEPILVGQGFDLVYY